MKIIKIILSFIVIGVFGFWSSAFAEGSAGLSISPLTFELTANRGDVLVNKIKISNPSNSIVAVKMEMEDFKPVGETGQVVVAPEEETTYSLKRWVIAEPASFTLEPNEQKYVEFTITIPENAEPGGKYGTILASTAGSISSDKVSGSAVAQKVGALLLLTVSGEVKENLVISEFTAPEFSEYGPVSFETKFKNEGSIHLRPKGFITIVDWRGEKVADLEFQQVNVIPGTVRKTETKWDKRWLAGKYTATLVGSYGTSNFPFDPPVITFWVFPWKIALGGFLILMAVIIFFYKTKKRWRLALKILLKGGA